MENLSSLPSVALYFSEGSSDKEYRANIAVSGNGYVVNFAYGRRGSALSTGCKTSAPVAFDKAVRVLEKLVAEKKAKGYTEAESGQAYANTELAGQVTGNVPQLLNAITEDELRRKFDDPRFGFQVKEDGERRMLDRKGSTIVASNRRGLACGLAQPLLEAALQLPADDFLLDGEQIGDTLYVFDILRLNGASMVHLPYQDRYDAYQAIAMPAGLCKVHLVTSPADKAALLATVKAEGLEGVVAKDLTAPYTPGRPNSGGSQLKFKIVETSSAIVLKINATKRSVSIGMLDAAGDVVAVGNVTVPPNQPVPAAGAIIDTQYLYRASEQGSLFQPVWVRLRTDITRSECVLSQIRRIKRQAAEPDDE